MDEDNPKGYYEFEKVKQVKDDQEWLEDAVGKVVKMVSMLLLDLPDDRHYKVVFMRREMSEILRSQRIMLERHGQEKVTAEEAAKEDRVMDYNYRRHLIKVHNAVIKKDNFEILYVKYNDFLADPAPHVKAVAEFFDGELDEAEMQKVVDPALYRNRKK